MNLKGRTLLLTGATGSFGSAFIQHLINTRNIPGYLIAYSRDWMKQKELRDKIGNPSWIHWVIGDIRDRDRLMEYKVDTVIHAAAIKDLPTCENNATECMKTNIIGTQNVIDMCTISRVEKAVLISTDKAVLPVNVYGTSKKMAEKLWISAGYNVARYGNVIGSAGSVLPVYRKLIAEGATRLPITDERMTRFWFSMKDAIELVFKTLTRDARGEVVVPQMPSIKIIDLCRALNMDYDIIGIRPGEKLHEHMIPPDPITNTEGYNSLNNPHFLSVEEIRRSIDGI